MWTDHPIFGVAKVSFCLALELSFILTIWLHLSYLPRLNKLPFFRLTGIILSFCEATLVFFTLLLFPINLWTFTLKKNISIPIGWGYFIGWLVFLLYAICGILCYVNYNPIWSPLQSFFCSMFCGLFPAQ